MKKRRKKRKKSQQDFDLSSFLPESALSRSIADIRGYSVESRLTEFATPLVERIENLYYDKTLKEFNGEDIARLLIQEFEPDLIIPLALSRVHKDLDSEGYAHGHLSELLLKISAKTWSSYPLLWQATCHWVEKHKEELRSRRLRLHILDLHVEMPY